MTVGVLVKMEKIYSLIGKIREVDYKNQELFRELENNLMNMSEHTRKNGRRMRFLIDGENFTTEESFLTGNRYEEVFLEDLVSWIVEVDRDVTSTETYLKIFEYMVRNDIRSYRQDW